MQALRSRATCNLGTCRGASWVSYTTAAVRRQRLTGFDNTQPLRPNRFTARIAYTTSCAADPASDKNEERQESKQCDTAAADIELGQQSFPRSFRSDSQPALAPSNQIHSRKRHVPDSADWDLAHQTVGVEITQDPTLHNSAEYNNDPIDIDGLWNMLDFDSRFPNAPRLEWPVNTGQELIQEFLPPQSLWSTNRSRREALKLKQTWKKLAIQELSIAVLIRQFLVHIRANSLTDDFLDDVDPSLKVISKFEKKRHVSHMRSLRAAIALMQNKSPGEVIATGRPQFVGKGAGQGIPQYDEDDEGVFHEVRGRMNASLKRMIETTRQSRDPNAVDIAIINLCHNLLVSTAAPDVQTFNLLMLAFRKWNRPELFGITIHILEFCKIRPNEITCVNILQYYTENDRPDDFARFVEKMRGVNDALTLARPDISITEKSNGRLIRIDDGKIYQKAHPSAMVFNSVILGVLKFAGFERALDIYYEMKEDAWGLDIVSLSCFLTDCIKRSDWGGGLYIWQEINTIKNHAKPNHVAHAYSHMLCLCTVTGQTVAFNQLLNEVAQLKSNSQEIVRAAMKMTKRITKQHNIQPPAFTADNVLIAASGFLNEIYSSKEEPDEDEAESESMAPTPSPAEEPPTTPTEEDLWEAWVEHEFNRKPVSPTSGTSEGNPEAAQSSTMQSSAETPEPTPQDELWKAWIEHELSRPGDPKTNTNGSKQEDKNTEETPREKKTPRSPDS